jgi:hypothetical protein
VITPTKIAEARLCAASAHSAAAALRITPQRIAPPINATQRNKPSPRHTALHRAPRSFATQLTA